MASGALKLQENTGYGHLPFDLFVLEHWDTTTSFTVHRQRWNEVARRYLRLPLIERWPLYKRCQDASSSVPNSRPPPTLTPLRVTEIFAPHQTIQERNLSARFCTGWNTVLLRTCYDPVLTPRYLEIERAAEVRFLGYSLESPEQILDNVLLYNFKGSDQEVLDQLLLRLPGLTDAMGITNEYGDESVLQYGSGQDDPERIAHAEEDEEYEEVRRVALRIQNFVYVVDEEAVGRGIVKVLWFDEFGKIIWDNVAGENSDLSGMSGAIMDGQGFEELVGEDSKRGDMIIR